MAENGGIQTNKGVVSISARTTNDVVVALAAVPPDQLLFPASVTVRAGNTNAFFNIGPIDDAIPETNMVITLAATSPAYAAGSAQTIIGDDDPASFKVSVPSDIYTAGEPRTVTFQALNPEGAPLTNGLYAAALSLLDSAGVVRATNQVALVNGAGSASILFDTNAIVRLHVEARNAFGDSRELSVIERFAAGVREAAWSAPRKLIYALEANQPGASNTVLFALDSARLVPVPITTLPGFASFLRLSPDGHFLHCAVLGGQSAMRIDLIGDTTNLIYDIGPADNKLLAFEVSPGDSTLVLTAGVNSGGGAVSLFRDGQKISQSLALPSLGFAFSASMKFNGATEAYLSGYPANDVVPLLISDSGVSRGDGYVRPRVSVGFLMVNGVMYSGSSEELAPRSGKLLRKVPTDTDSSTAQLEYRATADQLIYLQHSGPGLGTLEVFDRTTLARTATLPLETEGFADSVADLGDGRVLVQISGGDLAIVSSPSFRLDPGSDLSVRIDLDPAQPKLNEKVTIRMIVTNPGPAAVRAGLTAQLPAGFSMTNTTPFAPYYGTVFQAPQLVSWADLDLPPGNSLTNWITGAFLAADLMHLEAGIATASVDLNRSNNLAALDLPVVTELAPGESAPSAFTVSSIAYDSIRNQIIALTPPQSKYDGAVVAIDPATGLVAKTSQFGENAVTMSLADDSQTLYLAIDHGANIARASLASGSVEAVFSSAMPEGAVTQTVSWMAANPGHPDQLFVEADGKLGLFVNGHLLAWTNAFYAPLVAYGESQLVLSQDYSPFQMTLIRWDGQQFIFTQAGPTLMNHVNAGAGVFVAQDGRMLDTGTLTLLGNAPGSGTSLISAAERVIFRSDSTQLTGYDLDTQVTLETMQLPLNPAVTAGIVAGPATLAYQAADNDLVFVRRARSEKAPPADLGLSISSDGAWRVATPGTWTFTVENAGPNDAQRARVDVRFPEGFTSLQVTGANVLSAAVNLLSVDLGALPAGSITNFSVSALPGKAFTSAEIIGSVRSESIDANRSNNYARLVRQVEASGLPGVLETFDLAGSDVVYDRLAHKLYVASANGDGFAPSTNLYVVDPVSGHVDREIGLPGQPVRLALSAGSEFLYVALNGGQRIVRCLLPEFTLDLNFNTFVPESWQWYQVDMLVPPDEAHTVFVSLYGAAEPSGAGVYVYDDGQPRPSNIPGGWDGVTLITPGATPHEILAVGDPAGVENKLKRYRLTADGLEVGGDVPNRGRTFGLESAQNTVLVWPGELYDAATLEFRGELPTSFLSTAFAPDALALSADGQQAVLAAHINSQIHFEGFRTATRALSGSAKVPVDSLVRRLIVWERDGVVALAGHSLILGRLDLAADPITIAPFDANSFRLTFPAVAGRSWELQRAPTPSGPWTAVANAVATGALEVIPIVRDDSAAGFFRLLLP